MTITVIGNLGSDARWQVWVHLEPKQDPRSAGEAFIIGEGKTRDEAIKAAQGTLADATMQLEELAE